LYVYVFFAFLLHNDPSSFILLLDEVDIKHIRP
jgi:hypothetical protein